MKAILTLLAAGVLSLPVTAQEEWGPASVPTHYPQQKLVVYPPCDDYSTWSYFDEDGRQLPDARNASYWERCKSHDFGNKETTREADTLNAILTYYPDGGPRSSQQINAMFIVNGTFRYWNPDGHLLLKEIYEPASLKKRTTYFPTGGIRRQEVMGTSQDCYYCVIAKSVCYGLSGEIVPYSPFYIPAQFPHGNHAFSDALAHQLAAKLPDYNLHVTGMRETQGFMSCLPLFTNIGVKVDNNELKSNSIDSETGKAFDIDFYLSFRVDTTGKITRVWPSSPNGPSYPNAIQVPPRIISAITTLLLELPTNWEPARLEGLPVSDCFQVGFGFMPRKN